MQKLFLNQRGVIFIPRLDKKNGYQTIVCNPESGELFKIDKVEYFCLKLIDKNSNLDRSRIFESAANHEAEEFVDQMIKENIILTK